MGHYQSTEALFPFIKRKSTFTHYHSVGGGKDSPPLMRRIHFVVPEGGLLESVSPVAYETSADLQIIQKDVMITRRSMVSLKRRAFKLLSVANQEPCDQAEEIQLPISPISSI